MKLTINKNGEARKMKHAWGLVDWHQPTSVIAAKMEISERYVSGRRRKYAPETVRKHHWKTIKSKDMWDGVDWSKGPTKIARELGVKPDSVTRARIRISSRNNL
jgi:hypothetical protein